MLAIKSKKVVTTIANTKPMVEKLLIALAKVALM